MTRSPKPIHEGLNHPSGRGHEKQGKNTELQRVVETLRSYPLRKARVIPKAKLGEEATRNVGVKVLCGRLTERAAKGGRERAKKKGKSKIKPLSPLRSMPVIFPIERSRLSQRGKREGGKNKRNT